MAAKGGVGRTLLAVATLAVAAFGALIAYLQYSEPRDNERSQRVYRYSEKLAEETEAVARIDAMGSAFVEAWPNLVAAAGADPTADQIRALSDNWIVGVISADPELQAAVDKLAQFYDTLAVCVTEGSCDEPTAKTLFAHKVMKFTSAVYPWVAHQSEDYPSASGVQTMCLRNRFCAGQVNCTGLPSQLAACTGEAAPTSSN